MLKQVNRPTSFRFSSGHSFSADWSDYKLQTVEEVDAALRDTYQALFDAQRNMVQATINPINFKTNYPVYDNVPPLIIPTKLINCENKVAPIHKDFKRRSAAGEILMSDYHNWTAIIEYRPGKTVERVRPLLQENKVSGAYRDLQTSAIRGGPGAHEYVFARNRWWRCSVISQWETVYFGTQVSPQDVGWSDPSYNYLDELTRGAINGAEVQSVLADHNSRIVDASTALAEMPETVRSIINGIRECLRMYREARRKEIRLLNKAAEWKNGNYSKRHLRTVHRNISEIQSAISDVWLNFRYNIMPNVYLIEDLIKLVEQKDRLFIRDRSRVVRQIPFHRVVGFDPSFPEIELTERVLIKSRLDAEMAGIRSNISADLLVTAWELVPLSFIVDWFISVGDFLSSITPAASAAQGSTYSWKIDDVITYVHKPTGAAVIITFNGYDRAVIDPSQYCAIYYDFDFGLQRQLDAIALTWNILIKRHYRELS